LTEPAPRPKQTIIDTALLLAMGEADAAGVPKPYQRVVAEQILRRRRAHAAIRAERHELAEERRRAITEGTAPARAWEEVRDDYNNKGQTGDNYINEPVDFL
jgi:hypothetical protein